MLAGALSEHEGALRASVQAQYGIRLLRGGRTDPERSPLELADLVAHLPPGCALWRAAGGEYAWSAETHMLAHVEHGVRVLAWQQTKDGKEGRNQPKAAEPPALKHETDSESRRVEAKAERLSRRVRGG